MSPLKVIVSHYDSGPIDSDFYCLGEVLSCSSIPIWQWVNDGRCTGNPLSIVGVSNVDLPLGRRDTNLQWRPCTRRNGWSKGNSRYVDGSCNNHADSNSYGLPVCDITVSGEWLAKHHSRNLPFSFQSQWIAYLPFILRQVPDSCRTCVQCTDCLVCMELDLNEKIRPYVEDLRWYLVVSISRLMIL